MPDRRSSRWRVAVAAAVVLLCVVAVPGAVPEASAEPATTILGNGDPANRVDLAIIGDGYTSGEMVKFQADADRIVQRMFQQQPFLEYSPHFNVHRVDVISNQSGADHPERTPPVLVDTALDAAYGCSGIQRLICISSSKAWDVYGRSLSPAQYDIQLVLVNDPEYGGSGGSPAVASADSSVIELVLHELGHSFGALADEYGGGTGCVPGEPWEPNATATTTRDAIKWRAWIDPATPLPTSSFVPGVVGAFSGARYCDAGLYRPTFDSKMRTLGRSFEQVNTEQLVKEIYSRVSPIDAWAPADPTVAYVRGGSQTFTVSPLAPLTSVLDVRWEVDGTPVATTPSYTLAMDGLRAGLHTVRAVVSDPTPLVRTDPYELLTDTREWTVQVPTESGAFRPLPPTRVLDTRVGPGPVGTVGPESSLEVQMTGAAGVPASGVEAVVFNVTAVGPEAPGFLTVHPSGTTRPNASNLNFEAGEIVPNLVEVAVGAGGGVTLFNGSPGRTHYIVDVVGWVTDLAGAAGSAGRYHPLVPARLLDTRTPPAAPLRPTADLSLPVAGNGPVPAAGVAAVVLNVTVTGSDRGGWITAYPSGTTVPLASNLNFVAGQTVPNRVVVPVGADGRVRLHLGGGAGLAHVVADVSGWFGGESAPAGGSLFRGLAPTRIADTRGDEDILPSTPVGPEQTITVQVAGTPGVPPMGGAGAPSAAVLNVTVTGTTGTGYLTVFPSGAARPLASDQNWSPGTTRANLVVARLGPDGRVAIFNFAGSTHVIVDVLGFYG